MVVTRDASKPLTESKIIFDSVNGNGIPARS